MKTSWEIRKPKALPKLKTNAEADVLVIGAGMTGLWCAYLLAQAGRKVILIEKKENVAEDTTYYTTAFITEAIDTSFIKLNKIFGTSIAKLVWNAGSDAINLIRETVKNEKISCDFMKVPFKIYAASGDEIADLNEESKTIKKAGFEVSWEGPAKGFKNIKVFSIKNQAKYHPIKFAYGLRQACKKLGVEIYGKTEAKEVKGKIVTLTSGIKIRAEETIVSTYQPFNNPKAIKLKKGMYVSYVYELEIPKGSLKEEMYADMKNPYHYFRIDNKDSKHDSMIVGGEDHREEIPKMEKRSFKALDKFLEETFPGLPYKIVKKWTGPILEPVDGLAFIGRYESNHYLATAFSGNGMTYAAIAGMIIRDQILGKRNPYEKVFSPLRKMKGKAVLSKGKDYTGEFISGTVKNLL